MIVANIGRFGPYVKHGSEFRSLEPEDDVYTITLERAKELLAQEKKSLRRQRAAAKELRALGAHPESGRAAAHPRRPLRSRTSPTARPTRRCPRARRPRRLTMDEAKALLEARAGTAKPPRRRAAKKGGGRAARKGKSAEAVEA